MVPNYNYPWYIQHAPSFVKLYDRLFDIVSMATPLDVGYSFDLAKMGGDALFRLGILWGLQGAPKYYDGLIYKIDDWSDVKVWSGQARDIEGDIYRRFVTLHAYCNGRSFTLGLIGEAIAILMGDSEYKLTVDEDFMSFTINLEGDPETLRIIQEMQSYDPHFLGKPSGISYKFNYIPTIK